MKRFISILLAIVMVFSLTACSSSKEDAPADSGQTAAESQPFDVVDRRGRTVHFEKPAETAATVAIQGGAFMTMCALFGDKVTDHLVAWDGGLASWTDWSEVFYKALPGLKDVKNVGSFTADKMDIEGLIAIKPDVVFITDYYYRQEGGSDKIVPTLEAAGIPVIVEDYGADILEEHLACMELIGKVFGMEERAKELADFYKEQVELVFNKTDKLKADVKEPPVFYVEFAWMGAADQGLSYSNKSQWGNILTGIGASTLYGDSDVEFPEVDPEYILSSDPDGIILLGGWWGNEGQMPLGFLSNEEMVEKVMDEYCARPGWDQLKAVKNGQVYSLCNSLTHDIFSFCSFQQMAKIVYPEEFKDLDPNASLKAFFDEFMPIPYSGLWFHQRGISQGQETVSADGPFDIVDSVGRTVHFEKPADTCATVAIQGGAFMTMCALFGDKVTDHLVAWDGGITTWTDWGEAFYEALPALKDVPNIGTFNADKLDVETLLAIKPDVVMFPIYYYNLSGVNDKIVPTLEAAGIPVVVVDYRQDVLEEHLHCMEFIGKVFGKETRAKQLADFYKEQVDLVFSKTDKLKADVKEPPVFYVEFAWKGAADQGLSYSNKSQWGNILTSIGANTLYADADTEYPEVDPEYILSSDPDGIILLGGWWGNEGQMPLGFQSNEEMVDKVMAEYCARPGWDQLKAVKNNQVYSLCNSLTHDIFSFCSFQQMAKIVYPEEFKDLDPNASLKAFFDEFMPIPYSGLWFHQWNVSAEQAAVSADGPFDIVDSVGRTIHFDKTAETCATEALSNGAFLTMCALFGDKVTDHLVAWDDGLEAYPDWKPLFYEALPGLKDVKNVGYFYYPDSLDTEALIAIKPDVILLPVGRYEDDVMKDKVMPILEQAGIPVVFMDYTRNVLDTHLYSIEIIGRIFGEEARAKELADFYKEQVELVFDKTETLKTQLKAPPSFYLEYCWMGAADQGISFSNSSQWGNILTRLGATTIYPDADTEFPSVDPEYVLSSDPDGILLVGGWWGNEDQMPLGFLSNEEMVDKVMAQYCARPGWNQLKAVKNDRVYAICQALADDIMSFWSYQEAAKIIYPEEFKDLEPDAVMKEFFDRFMPVEYTGLWFRDMADSAALSNAA